MSKIAAYCSSNDFSSLILGDNSQVIGEENFSLVGGSHEYVQSAKESILAGVNPEPQEYDSYESFLKKEKIISARVHAGVTRKENKSSNPRKKHQWDISRRDHGSLKAVKELAFQEQEREDDFLEKERELFQEIDIMSYVFKSEEEIYEEEIADLGLGQELSQWTVEIICLCKYGFSGILGDVSAA